MKVGDVVPATVAKARGLYGGVWRIVCVDADGFVLVSNGQAETVIAPERGVVARLLSFFGVSR